MKGYPTLFNGIIFTEALVDGPIVGQLKSDLSFKIGAQLKTLNDVKADLVRKAAFFQANCVSEFKYGQKSRWLAIDDVAYFGSGNAVQLSPAGYKKIVDYINERDSR